MNRHIYILETERHGRYGVYSSLRKARRSMLYYIQDMIVQEEYEELVIDKLEAEVKGSYPTIRAYINKELVL